VCASYRAGKKNTGPPHYYDSFDRLLAFFWFGWSFTVLSGIQTPCFIKIKFKKNLFFLYTILKIIFLIYSFKKYFKNNYYRYLGEGAAGVN
jgi:magnesium-transporting ATPase (P-type)